MNRSDFQKLAALRLTEGKVLLDAGYYTGAYYLLGYAVECALKACIAKKTNLHDFPPTRQVVESVYTHDLKRLLTQSGLAQSFEEARNHDPVLEVNWAIVTVWAEDSRYDLAIPTSKANDLYNAIAQPGNGVLSWFMNLW